MLENSVLRYLLYGTSAVIVSQVIYSLCKSLSNALPAKRKTEIYEVIWINELSSKCTYPHAESTVSKSPNVEICESTLCGNRYCFFYNVGRLSELIDQAMYSIDLAMYVFTSYDLSNAIMRAFKRGVLVRVISDKEMVYSSGSQMLTLVKAGIAVRYPSKECLMHHKFCILDGRARVNTILKKRGGNSKGVQGILMSGSSNWTTNAFNGNWENILITSNNAVIAEYEEEFERLWQALAAKSFQTKPAQQDG